MAPEGLSPSSPCIHLQEWRDAYAAALKETNTFALFKCVEVAEAAALTRRFNLPRSSGCAEERREIEAALVALGVLKRDRLQFDDRT